MGDFTGEEMSLAQEAFAQLDRMKKGQINYSQLDHFFSLVGEQPNNEQIKKIQEELQPEKLTLEVLLQFWSKIKELKLKEEAGADNDILNAFIALSETNDRNGTVTKKRIKELLIDIFELKVDLDEMYQEAGLEKIDELTFYHFACFLEAGGSAQRHRLCSFLSTRLSSV